ncbi:GAP family protein [Rhodococcus sp. W8901]|uniref:GAP family protein n=1 Tax=Rhodococcus sp. W8901 TaxID=2742603 RepID=UPI0020C71B14|nr:GAP family protein [Rhodococcus sp. W8901]
MLGSVIGETLPLALGIAISPFTIIAAILMLLSSSARRTGPGFLIGWILGIAIAVTAFVLLAGLLTPHGDSGGSNVPRVIVQLLLSALLLLLAVRQWRGRPKPGVDPALPKWMAAIDGFTLKRAFGLGLLLSALNPKNLLIAASAGVTIGDAGLAALPASIATGVFVLCATSTVWVLVSAFIVASEQLRGPLDALHRWLVRENNVVMTVLMAFMAALILGKAIASL